MDAIEGHRGRSTCRGVNISTDGWKVKTGAGEVPANDHESVYRKQKFGLRGAEVELHGYVDADNNPFADAGGGLRSGEQIACSTYLIKGSLVWTFSKLDLFDIECSNELEGKVEFTAKGKSNGPWTYPGGAAG